MKHPRSRNTTKVSFHKDTIFNVKGQPETHLSLLLRNKYKTTYHPTPPDEGILDSGATDSFLPMSYKGTNEQLKHQQVVVGCANGATMTSSATDDLDLPSLPAAARSCYKFHEIAEPLISVKKIVKNGCSVLFEATKVTVKDTTTGKPVLTGRFNPVKNLYTVPLHGDPGGTLKAQAYSTGEPHGAATGKAYSSVEPHGTKAYSTGEPRRTTMDKAYLPVEAHGTEAHLTVGQQRTAASKDYPMTDPPRLWCNGI